MTAVLMVGVPVIGAFVAAVVTWGGLIWACHRIVNRLAGGSS